MQNSSTEQINFSVELGPDWFLGLRVTETEDEKWNLGYVLCKLG